MNTEIVSIGTLRPALTSVNDACRYLGGVSRAKFYGDILPQIESVLVGGRRFVVVASMDRFIQSNMAS